MERLSPRIDLIYWRPPEIFGSHLRDGGWGLLSGRVVSDGHETLAGISQDVSES